MMAAQKKKPKVLLVGWDAADWKVINPLLDAGKMPALARLVNHGVMGNIATLDPPLSPMLWTSIATGMRADKHGILGFAEPDTKSMGVRPVNVTSRKVKAVWNILNQNGFRSNVISWWPSHPAEPINGVYVSNFFSKASKKPEATQELPRKSVHPPQQIKNLIDLRVFPEELTFAHLLPFVPEAAQVNQEKENELGAIAKFISEAATVQAVATQVMEHTDWDFMAVYFDMIDHFCHGFMKYHPPRQQHIDERKFRLFNQVVEGAYIFQDMMLERMMDLCGEDTVYIIVSDHGFHSDHLRLPYLPELPAAPALEHNPLGMLCISGPGIKKDDRVYGATLLDITPTILAMFGLPIGQDMDGKPLLNIFEQGTVPEYIPSWESREGEAGMHPPDAIEDTFASAEAMQQLIELGYIEDPGPDKKKGMEKATMEAEYNLSRVLASKRDYAGAAEMAEKLVEKEPGELRFSMDLMKYYLELRRIPEARAIMDKIRADDPEGNYPALDLLEGIICFHEEDSDNALALLQKAESSNPHLPVLHCEIGKVYIRTEQYPQGLEAFEKALAIDPQNAIALHGKSICLLRMHLYDEAADAALDAIGITYFYPPAHYHLAEALFHLQQYKESAQAFEVCLSMAPGNMMARSWLVRLYNDHLNEPEKAKMHEDVLEKTKPGDIVIVSGLPRSGTSLMMQMLEAGGLEIYTDEVRQPDINNPKGYYEYEKVKSLARDSAWVPDAKGKVIKVIAQLLQFLPRDQKYKIIFMQREMKEVIRSQQKMIGKNPDTYPLAVVQAFEKEIQKVMAWAEKEPFVDLISLNYADIVSDPPAEIKKISTFLKRYIDEDEMVKVVDPTLYRNKAAEG